MQRHACGCALAAKRDVCRDVLRVLNGGKFSQTHEIPEEFIAPIRELRERLAAQLHTWPDGQVRPEKPYPCGCFMASQATGIQQCTLLSDHDGDHVFS